MFFEDLYLSNHWREPFDIYAPTIQRMVEGHQVLPLSVCAFVSGSLLINHMEYIHKTSQIGKSYWEGVLQTRKTTLVNSV